MLNSIILLTTHVMGQCTSHATLNKQQHIMADQVNPYGINTSATPYEDQFYPNPHSYF